MGNWYSILLTTVVTFTVLILLDMVIDTGLTSVFN